MTTGKKIKARKTVQKYDLKKVGIDIAVNRNMTYIYEKGTCLR